jgi:hypothetical protein
MNPEIQKQQKQQEQKPELVQATIDQEDITESLKILYGEDKDWNHRTVHYRDFLTSKDLGRDLCLKWRRKNGRVDCVITRIRDLDAEFHGDLFYQTRK